MSHSHTLATALAACALLLVACSVPRKAQERACHRADKILQRAAVRAAFRCPTAVLRNEATVLADTITIRPELADTIAVDSVLLHCDELRRAVEKERDLYSALMIQYAKDSEQYQDALALGKTTSPVRVPVSALPPATRKAVNALRDLGCTWEPVHLDFETITVDVLPGAHQPLVTVTQKGRKIPCPPVVGAIPCPDPGVSPFYKVATWVLLVLSLLLGAVVYFMYTNWKRTG